MSGSTHHIYLSAAHVDILEKLREERGQSKSEILRAGLDALADMNPVARLAGLEGELKEIDARRKVLKAEIRRLTRSREAESSSCAGGTCCVQSDSDTVRKQTKRREMAAEDFQRYIEYINDTELHLEPDARVRLIRRVLRLGDEHSDWVDSLPHRLKATYRELLDSRVKADQEPGPPA